MPVEPEPLQLGEDVQRLELLQVEDLRVGQPELLDEVDVDGDPGVGAVGDQVHLVLVDEHPPVRPADDEEGVERDAVQGCPFTVTLVTMRQPLNGTTDNLLDPFSRVSM